MRQKAFVIVLAALVMGLSVGWYFGTGPDPQAPQQNYLLGTVWPDPRPLPEFRLADHSGNEFVRDRLQGQWTLIFFGYTSCPDICPTTMLILRDTISQMQQSGAIAPHVVLISVDPDRDSAESLAAYVGNFDKDFVGVRGGEDELRKLALPIGAMYQRDAPDEQGGYDVAHSASLFLIDPEARVHAVFSQPHQSADLAEKLAAIRLGYEQG